MLVKLWIYVFNIEFRISQICFLPTETLYSFAKSITLHELAVTVAKHCSIRVLLLMSMYIHRLDVSKGLGNTELV